MNTRIFKRIAAIAAIALATTGATTQEEAKTMYLVKNNMVIREIAVSRIDSIIFYNPSNPNPFPPTFDEGVIINGVKWATRNVAEPGLFATDPEDAGMFYQWNRKKAWSPACKATDMTDDFYNLTSGEFWEEANDPTPAGWRIPATSDFTKLCDKSKVNNEWVIVNGKNGRRFTDKETGNSIFLPAVGSIRGGGKNLTPNHGYYLTNESYYDSLWDFYGCIGFVFYQHHLYDGYFDPVSYSAANIRPVAD